MYIQYTYTYVCTHIYIYIYMYIVVSARAATGCSDCPRLSAPWTTGPENPAQNHSRLWYVIVDCMLCYSIV